MIFYEALNGRLQLVGLLRYEKNLTELVRELRQSFLTDTELREAAGIRKL